jgi:hypothetical protein
MSLNEILDELPRLSEDERSRLQEELDAFHPEQERELARVAQERLRELETGETRPISAEEVFAKARQRISE